MKNPQSVRALREPGAIFTRVARVCEPLGPVSLLPVGFVRAACVAAGLLFIEGTALAEAPAPAASSEAASPSAPSETLPLAGFDLLASAGFGTSTMNVAHLNLEPYATSFGLDLGYTFKSGLRMGAYFQYSLGKTEHQKYNPLLGRPLEFDAVTSSVHGGITFGWDVPLYVLVLRYQLSFGLSAMNWDFGSSAGVVGRFDGASNPTVGFHFAPGLALLYRSGIFEGGAGFDYFVQTSGIIPSGVVARALAGVKF